MMGDYRYVYRYVVWCRECWGVDPDGCFDGGMHTSEDTYATPTEADAAAEAFVGDAMWQFQVVDEQGAFVDVPATPADAGEGSDGR